MNIWHASQKTGEYVNVFGYAGIVLGTLSGLVGYLAETTSFAVVLLITSPLLIAVGTLFTFWASGIQSIHSDRAISSANATAERAQLASIEAQVSLERERQARVRLELSLKPRALAPEASDLFAAEVQRLSRARDGDLDQQVSAAVFSVAGTIESHQIADQIAAALDTAGFSINRHPVMYGMNYVLSGIGVLTSDLPEAIERGDIIRTALGKAGLLTVELPNRSASSGEAQGTRLFNLGVSIAVGDRP